MFDRVLTHHSGDLIIYQKKIAFVCSNLWEARYKYERADMLVITLDKLSQLVLSDVSDTLADLCLTQRLLKTS